MSKVQFNTRIDSNLKEALTAYATAQNTTITSVVDAALREFLDPDDYRTASLNHLTQINRQLAVLLRRDETILETLGRFILVYLLHTPPLPESERDAARREASQRYDVFTQRLAQSLNRNKTFLKAVEEASPSPEELFKQYQRSQKNA